MSHIKRRIVTILKDDYLNTIEKLEILRQLEADARARERSATEGMPSQAHGDDGEDLKLIEQALLKLGQLPAENGAATL